MGRRRATGKRIPLSALDKTIYFIVTIGGVLSIILLYVHLAFVLPMELAFADPNAVAVDNRAMLLCAFPFSVLFPLPFAIVGGRLWDAKYPLFGNPRYRPKWSVPVIREEPLFSKAYWRGLSQQKRQRFRRIGIIVLCVWLVSLLILPLGLYQRRVVDREGVIKSYGIRNQLLDSRRSEHAEELIIDVHYSSGSRHSRRSWRIELTFVFADGSYTFVEGDFYGVEKQEVMTRMLEIKSRFAPDRYRFTNLDRLEDLIDYREYDAPTRALVYQLFDRGTP